MHKTLLNLVITNRHKTCLSTLDAKGEIYATQNDRLSNFKDVAQLNQTTAQKALWGMLSKHLITVRDMILSEKRPNDRWMEEYLGDVHNYIYLLEALWKEENATFSNN